MRVVVVSVEMMKEEGEKRATFSDAQFFWKIYWLVERLPYTEMK